MGVTGWRMWCGRCTTAAEGAACQKSRLTQAEALVRQLWRGRWHRGEGHRCSDLDTQFAVLSKIKERHTLLFVKEKTCVFVSNTSLLQALYSAGWEKFSSIPRAQCPKGALEGREQVT